MILTMLGFIAAACIINGLIFYRLGQKHGAEEAAAWKAFETSQDEILKLLKK
jgi:hypothetical protein